MRIKNTGYIFEPLTKIDYLDIPFFKRNNWFDQTTKFCADQVTWIRSYTSNWDYYLDKTLNVIQVSKNGSDKIVFNLPDWIIERMKTRREIEQWDVRSSPIDIEYIDWLFSIEINESDEWEKNPIWILNEFWKILNFNDYSNKRTIQLLSDWTIFVKESSNDNFRKIPIWEMFPDVEIIDNWLFKINGALFYKKWMEINHLKEYFLNIEYLKLGSKKCEIVENNLKIDWKMFRKKILKL